MNAVGSQTTKTAEERIKELPPELRREVEDFIEFLVEKRRKRAHGKPNFGWAGALKDSRNRYTSEELRPKIAE